MPTGRRNGRRTSGWWPAPGAALARLLGAGLLVLALLSQSYIAERHFHNIGQAGAGTQTQARASGPANPLSPLPQDDDCPLCQVLGLGATTDVPHAIVMFEPMLSVEPVAVAPTGSHPLGRYLSGHRPRGPPSPIIA